MVLDVEEILFNLIFWFVQGKVFNLTSRCIHVWHVVHDSVSMGITRIWNTSGFILGTKKLLEPGTCSVMSCPIQSSVPNVPLCPCYIICDVQWQQVLKRREEKRGKLANRENSLPSQRMRYSHYQEHPIHMIAHLFFFKFMGLHSTLLL